MPADSKARSRRRGGLIAASTGFAFLLPLFYLAGESIGLGSGLWAKATSIDILGPLWRSAILAVTTAILSAGVGAVTAILVVRSDIPGRRILRILLALPLAIPSFVGATALLVAFGSGGLVPFVPRPQGFWGALVVLTLLSYPYVYLPVLARLRTTSAAMEDAARQLGSTPQQMMRRIVIPQIRGAIGAGTMLVFLYVLSDFGAVSLLRYDTITRVIFASRLSDRSTALALAFLLALLALGVAGVERAASRGPNVVAASGRSLPRYPLGRFRLPAAGFAAVVVAGGLLAPIGVFIAWLGSGSGGLGRADVGSLIEPAANSVIAATSAGVAAVALLLPLAYVSTRYKSRVGDAASTVVTSLFAVPGLAVALAIVFWAIRAPEPLARLYQSFPLLIAAYVLHFGAQSLRASQAAVATVSARFDEAARTLGVGWWRRFTGIELPLMSRGLISGGGLVMLSTLKELPATLLLAPIGFGTLATRIWGAANDGFYGEVGLLSLGTISVSGLLTWFLVVRPIVGSPPILGSSGPS